ncbi:thiamine diphosphokinase [Treponema sp.]|uniref:thiamine diphosphokinase n=1 Tax=Treponema sp. TaxID=166 RepID=UPI0025ED27B0|nr:thiamine diphosphokinase [Treponema sp.]MCR5218902.1 thiamine diphosphokinase [Treponema sp.]
MDYKNKSIPQNKRCVIVGAADIKNTDFIKSCLNENDYFIFCDGGLRHAPLLGVSPDLAVGDFDSYPKIPNNAETIVLPCEKDDTDTNYAVKEGLYRGFSDFLLIGVTGLRMDHTIANVSILLKLHALGKKAVIIDDYSQMEIAGKNPMYIEEKYPYFSLLNICGTARGITIKDAKYPLENGEITCEYQYGISNEVLPGKTACVTVNEGNLLLIKIFEDDKNQPRL